MSKVVNIICICLVCCNSVLTAQVQPRRPDADNLFMQARDAAFAERYAEARKICRELLSYYPDYYDATMLLGRTYAWESKTDSARMIISPLLDIEPDSYDVLDLLVDNEIWGGQYDKGLDYIDLALGYYPDDEEFLFKKANAYYHKKDNTEAIKVLSELLNINPEHVKGNELLNIILPPQRRIDDLYHKADAEAKAGHWKKSRMYCREILKEEPTHFPATFLMANMFAFENKFDSARFIANKLHLDDPTNYDVLDLMVNIEIWNRKYKAALTQVNKALEAYPEDENFLYKKALIQYLSKDYNDALKTLDDELLVINPEHEDGLALRDLILQHHRYRDYVFLEEYFESFNEPWTSRRFVTSAGLSKWTKYGTYIAKINEGEHFPRYSPTTNELYYDSPAFQYELEAYQTLTSVNYLWLNYAWSKDDFFPNHRGGIEFFQRLPKGFEASLGLRFLYWDHIIWIYTGSISWMKNRNYLAFRPFFCNTDGWTQTYIFTYRRYFSERVNDYAYAMLGYGNYSDDFLQMSSSLSSSYMAQLGVLKFLTLRWTVAASVGYAYDMKLAVGPSSSIDRNRFQASAGIRYYFNMFK